jgi:hypothetical protein
MIATRTQEDAFGTLARPMLKLLDGLARRHGSRATERNLKTAPSWSATIGRAQYRRQAGRACRPGQLREMRLIHTAHTAPRRL